MDGDMSQGLSSHGYLQDDMDFDALINQSSWPASTTPLHQYSPYPAPSQSHTPQNNFTQYQPPSNPSPYGYDLPQSQQSSFQQMPYSNSPYSLPQSQSQYQQPLRRPSPNEYNIAAYNLVDTPLHQSTSYQPPAHTFPYPPQQNGHATISPHSLYAHPASQLQINRGNSNSPYQQPAHTPAHTFNQPTQSSVGSYYNNFQYDSLPQNQVSSAQYPRIPSATSEVRPVTTKPVVEIPYKSIHDQSLQSAPPAQPAVLRPSSTLRVYRPELLLKRETELRHPLNHAPYVVFTSVTGLKNKKSDSKVAKIRKAKATGDPSLSSTEPKKRGRPRKDQTATGYQGTSRPPKIKAAKIQREDGTISKSASPSETSSSDGDSSSEYESEYEEDVKMPVVDISTVRDVERPKDSALAAAWDAIGIIWKDPYQNPSQEAVSDAVSRYGQFVMGFRNQIKTIITKIDDASNKPAELSHLQAEQTVLLESLYQVVAATLKHGAPFIVQQLGNHQQLVNALISTLRDCIKANDYTSKLPKATLELLARFKTLTDDILKKCKFDGVQKRWIKKGDKDGNQKFIDILANTVDSQSKLSKVNKSEADKKARDVQEQAKLRAAEIVKPATNGPVKRPLDDPTNSKPAKKFAADANGNSLATKPVTVKKPTANLLGIATRPVAKPVVKKREPSPPQESKLGALLASIAKPAEVPRAPSAPIRPPETPEEKARRERKESRRHLRVKFKEGAELEQIKLFKHEQDEDEGRQDDMLRDATDMHNEGMMHKRRSSEVMDLDDDDYQPPDVEEPVFTEPKNIDFSQSAKSSLFGPTYYTRGGDLGVHSSEQETQARREAAELLVIYSNPEDIPPSAREPSAVEEVGDERSVKALKQSNIPWHIQRLQELDHYGSDRAFPIFATRVSIESPEERAHRLHPNGIPANNSTQSTQEGFAPQDVSGVAKPVLPETNALLDAFEMLRGKAFPPSEPPVWMVNPRHRAIWLEGYERDNPARGQIIPEQQSFVPQGPPIPNPPMNLPTQQNQGQLIPPFPPPPLADIAQNLFAGYGKDDHAPPAPFDYNTWAASNLPQTQPARTFGREENERPRRDEDESRAVGKKKKLKNWERFDENGEYRGPKLPCRFYAIGQCRKGAGCTYSHDQVPEL